MYAPSKLSVRKPAAHSSLALNTKERHILKSIPIVSDYMQGGGQKRANQKKYFGGR